MRNKFTFIDATVADVESFVNEEVGFEVRNQLDRFFFHRFPKGIHTYGSSVEESIRDAMRTL